MDADSEIYVISEADLKSALVKEGNDPEEVADLESNFDLDGTIAQYGKAVQPINNQFNEGVLYALEYLSDLYDGIKETDLWAEYIVEQEAN